MPPPAPTSSATTIRALQASSIIIASTASGLGAALSFFVVPRLMELPTHLLIRQFNRMIGISRIVMPILLLIPSILSAVAAKLLRDQTISRYSLKSIGGGGSGSGWGAVFTRGFFNFSAAPWKWHALAAVVSFSMVPWTMVVMLPMNRMMAARGKHVSTSSSSSARAKEKVALESAENSAQRRGERSSHEVLDRWALFNLFRPTVSLVAAGITAYASIW